MTEKNTTPDVVKLWYALKEEATTNDLTTTPDEYAAKWDLEGAEPRTEKGVTIHIIDTDDEVTGWNRDAQLIGPDGKEYRLVMSYDAVCGYDVPDWYDGDTGKQIDEPEWAANLTTFDLDCFTLLR